MESKIVKISEKLHYNMKILFRYYAYKYDGVFYSERARFSAGRKMINIELDELERILDQIKLGYSKRPQLYNKRKYGVSELIRVLGNIVTEAKNESK